MTKKHSRVRFLAFWFEIIFNGQNILEAIRTVFPVMEVGT